MKKFKVCVYSVTALFMSLGCSHINANANTKTHYLYNTIALSETVGVRFPWPITQIQDSHPNSLTELFEYSKNELDPLVLKALSLGAEKAFYGCNDPDEKVDSHNIDNYHGYSSFYLAILAVKNNSDIREAEIEDIISYVTPYIRELSYYLVRRWDISSELKEINQDNRNSLLLDDLKQLGLEDSISVSRYLLINIGLTAANMSCDPQTLINADAPLLSRPTAQH